MTPTIQPEYCLLWIDHWSICMQKSEWSSWVQAFGSVAAIIGAAWIAGDQERKRALRQKQAAISKARTFAGSLMGVAEDIREHGALALVYIHARRVVLEELVQDSRGIPSETLHLSWISAIAALRSVAVQMAQALRDAEAVQDKSGDFELTNRAKYQHMEKTVADLEAKASKHIEVLIAPHPGVRMYGDAH